MTNHRIWIDYSDADQGDLVLDNRHGQLLVERNSLTPTPDDAPAKLPAVDVNGVRTPIEKVRWWW